MTFPKSKPPHNIRVLHGWLREYAREHNLPEGRLKHAACTETLDGRDNPRVRDLIDLQLVQPLLDDTRPSPRPTDMPSGLRRTRHPSLAPHPDDPDDVANRLVEAARLGEPDALDPERFAERLEVAVVVQDGSTPLSRCGRDQVVGCGQAPRSAEIARGG